MLQDDVILVLTSAPDIELANQIARHTVTQGLAACANISSPVMSVYSWQNNIESAQEIPLTLKTTWGRFDELSTWIKAFHPYDVPEIIVVPVLAGDTAYLNWVRDVTTERSV